MVELNMYKYERHCIPEVVSYGTLNCDAGTVPEIKLVSINRIDLMDETTIGLNKDIFNMLDITKISDVFSYDFVIPATDSNTIFFENFGNLNWVGKAKFNAYDAELVSDGISIFAGQFILTDYDANRKVYTGRLVGNIPNIASALKDKNVNTLEYLNRFNHEYTGVATVTDSWIGELKRGDIVSSGKCFDVDGNEIECTVDSVINYNKEIMYPLSDEQGLGYWHQAGDAQYLFWSPFSIDAFRTDVVKRPIDASVLTPAVKLVPLVQAIFQEAGFVADLSYFNGPRWDNLYINTQQVDEDKIGDVKPLALMRLISDYSRSTSDSFTSKLPMETVEGSRYTTSDYYFPPVDGDYTINLKVKGRLDNPWLGGNSSANVKIKRYVEATTLTETVVTIDLQESGSNQTENKAVGIDLKVGDYIYLEFGFSHNYGESKMYLDIITGFEITAAPPLEVVLNRIVGYYFKDATQLDVLKEFLALSNSVIEYDDDLTNVTVTPIINKWLSKSAVQMDITSKIDRAKQFKVSPATSLMPDVIEFKWAEANDVLAQAYKTGHDGVAYGATKIVNTNVIGADDSFTHTSNLQPFTSGAISSITSAVRDGIETNTTGLVIPMNYKDVNKFNSVTAKLSLFYWDSAKKRTLPKSDYYLMTNWIKGQEVVEQIDYPMCHNLLFTRSDYAFEPGVIDINWEASIPFSVNGDFAANGVNNNLFDTFYRGYLSALYEDDAVVIDTSVVLSPSEFKGLDMFAPVMLDGSRYRILNYKEYDVLGTKPMKISLIKDNIEILSDLKPTLSAAWYGSTSEVVINWSTTIIEPSSTELRWKLASGIWNVVDVTGLNTYTVPGIGQTYEYQDFFIEVTNTYGLSTGSTATFTLSLQPTALLKPTQLSATYDTNTEEATFTWLNSTGAQQYDVGWIINQEYGDVYTVESNVTTPFTKSFLKQSVEGKLDWYVNAITTGQEAHDQGNRVIIPSNQAPVSTPTALYGTYSQGAQELSFFWSEVNASSSMELYWEECGDGCVIDANVIALPANSTTATAPFTSDFSGHNIKFYVRNISTGVHYDSTEASLWVDAKNKGIPVMLSLTYDEPNTKLIATWSAVTDAYGYNCSLWKNGSYVTAAVWSGDEPLPTTTYEWTGISRESADVSYEVGAAGMFEYEPGKYTTGEFTYPRMSVNVAAVPLGVPAVQSELYEVSDGTSGRYIWFSKVVGATGYGLKYRMNSDPFVVVENHATEPQSTDDLRCTEPYTRTVAEQTMTMAVRARFGTDAGAWSVEVTSPVYTAWPDRAVNVRFTNFDEDLGTMDIEFDYADMSGIDHFVVRKMQYDQENRYQDVNVGLNKVLNLTNVFRLESDYKVYAIVEAYSTSGKDTSTNAVNVIIPKV